MHLSPVDVELSAIQLMGYGPNGHPVFRVHLTPRGRQVLLNFSELATGHAVEILLFESVLTRVFFGPALDVPYFTATVADKTLAGKMLAVSLGIVRVPQAAIRRT